MVREIVNYYWKMAFVASIAVMLSRWVLIFTGSATPKVLEDLYVLGYALLASGFVVLMARNLLGWRR